MSQRDLLQAGMAGGITMAASSALGAGTETGGSIVRPPDACSLVGIEPTLGLMSRSGIVRAAHS